MPKKAAAASSRRLKIRGRLGRAWAWTRKHSKAAVTLIVVPGVVVPLTTFLVGLGTQRIHPHHGPAKTTAAATPAKGRQGGESELPFALDLQMDPDGVQSPTVHFDKYMVPIDRRVQGRPSSTVDCTGMYEFAMKQHGVPISVQGFRMIARGAGDGKTLLTGLRIHFLSRRPPIAHGTYIRCGGGEEGDVRSVVVDLDHPNDPTYEIRTSGLGKETKHPFYFTLAKGETEIFDVQAKTARCWCRFTLLLDYIRPDGGKGTMQITPPDFPYFQVTDAPRGGEDFVVSEHGWFDEPTGKIRSYDQPLPPTDP